MMDISNLIYRSLSGELTVEESRELEQWLETPGNSAYFRELTSPEQLEAGIRQTYAMLDARNRVEARVMAGISGTRMVPGIRTRRILRWWSAAAMIILLAGGAYFLLRPSVQPAAITADASIIPGSRKAILTLGDGSTITLDSAGNRFIAPGIRQQSGQLQYEQSTSVSYNTLTIPRGGHFSLQLPDGTTVWLNASSSLKYPTAFEKERVVEITGEAYFEVARNPAMPFRVKFRNTFIEVLGTSFNINTYTDEPAANATLLSGSIRIQNIVLKPGEQALISDKGIHVQKADTDKAIAWKNGVFNFNQTSVQEAMRQIARWYDIQVVYEKNIPQIAFWGKIGRDMNLSQLLYFLEGSGLHVRVEERKLIVMP